jgi:flagellar hook-associated protein 2
MGSTIFSGSSRYSNDFVQIIERAVGIASLPVLQLKNQRNELNDQATALKSIDDKFTALQASIDALRSATTGSGSLAAAVSDDSVLRATVGTGALADSYDIEVISLGAESRALSPNTLPVVDDPYTQNITTAATLTLIVAGTPITIVPGSQSLFGLVTAINSANAGVRATIVNLGSTTAPDYRLAVRSDSLADVSIQLNDGSSDLLESIATGAPAQYRINGQPATPISGDSRSVLVSPGLTVDLLKTGTATVSVTQSASTLRDAVTAFATSFNAAVDELDLHRGENAGALSGNSIVTELSRSLREVAGYNGTGIPNLDAIGLSFDRFGHLVLDETAFNDAAATDLDEAFAFLAGFAESAGELLDQLEDPVDGLIDSAIDSLNRQITEQDNRIAENQARVDQIRESLTAKIAAADALIASLEQQVILFNGLFESMRYNNERS